MKVGLRIQVWGAWAMMLLRQYALHHTRQIALYPPYQKRIRPSDSDPSSSDPNLWALLLNSSAIWDRIEQGLNVSCWIERLHCSCTEKLLMPHAMPIA